MAERLFNALYRQELSCRKQIARQLHTQYAEGIYDNPVTLKSRLTVTQIKSNQIKSEKLTIAPHHQSSIALVTAD